MTKKRKLSLLIKETILGATTLLCCCSLLVYASQPVKTVVRIQHWKTTKGVPVYFVRAPSLPMLDIRIIFAAGSAYDQQNWGLAELANSSLNQGTATLSNKQIANNFEQVGARYSTNVTKDMAIVSLRTLTKADYLPKALATFHAVLIDPAFYPPSLNLVKQQMTASIRYKKQSPRKIASDHFFSLVFNKSAYAHPVIGTIATLTKVTPAMVKQFYQQYYVAKNAKIVLVGDLTQQQAKRIAAEVVEGLPTGNKPIPLAKVKLAKVEAQDNTHINFNSNQSSIFLGYPSITRDNPDYFPLIVGSQILGGSTMTSLLFQNIREKRGLTYGVYSIVNALQYAGSFYIALNTKTQSRQEALTAVKTTLSKFVLKGPTDQQLQSAQDFLIHSFPLSLASNRDILSVLTYMAFYHRPLNFLDTYQQRIAKVTKLQIKHIFTQLTKQHMIVVTVGKNYS